MKKLTVKLQRRPNDACVVGTLGEKNRRVFFEYDSAFIETGLELSPFKLRLQPSLIEHTDHRFGLLPGVFDDSLPDGWGLVLMDRHFRRSGIDLASVTALDRLAYLGTRTMGALTYHPPQVVESNDQLLDLYELGRNAEEVLAGEAAEVLPELLRAGGSPGGARPKVLVGLKDEQIISGEADLPAGFEHWIVKFSSRADAESAGPIEYAYSLMAKAAGIDMPPTRLLTVRKGRDIRRCFAIQRFDRGVGNRRMHMHTFGNMVHANFRIPSTDYADMFKATRSLTRNHGHLLELFRRMVFNVAAHNRDDHAKNFAFLLDDETRLWRLSPAYDLVFAAGPGGEHSTTIAGEGRHPGREHCLALLEGVGIEKRQGEAIIEEVNAAVVGWATFAEEAGCSRKVARVVAEALRQL